MQSHINYRLDFLVLLANIFLPPTVLVYGLLLFDVLPYVVRSSSFLRISSYLLVYLSYWAANVKYKQLKNELEASRRGSVMPVRLRGKWPGNIDVVVDAVKSYRTGYALEFYERRLNENNCDTLNLRFFWTDLYLTRDNRIIKTVLTTNSNFGVGRSTQTQMHDLFGDGIIMCQGEASTAHRALVRPFFGGYLPFRGKGTFIMNSTARERSRDFQLSDRYLQKCIGAMRSRAQSNKPVDFQDIFRRFTFDVAGELLFGTDIVRTLDEPLPEPEQTTVEDQESSAKGSYSEFARAFHQLQVLTLDRQRSSYFWPVKEFFKNKTTTYTQTVDSWIMPRVMEALNKKELREGDAKSDEASFVDYLVDSTGDLKFIRDELLNALIAARDDLASLFTFVMYALSIHPDITSRLRAEVIDTVPEGLPSFDQIREMKYLRAVINETLRLFPPVVLSGRASRESFLLPPDRTSEDKPIFIPGNDTLIIFPFLLMQRRKDLWGEDADQFKPERWLDERRTMNFDSSAFLPFGVGPKRCLGQSFAYHHTSFVIIRLLQVFDSFELRQKDGAPPGSCPPDSWRNAGGRKAIEQVWPRVAVALFAQGGLWIKPVVASQMAQGSRLES
ncbi:cytochrome P450 monooxygenase CYP63 [Cantharellus anzutake]|uniref:cytochrome P450 monooxygenase CYP63 n=1 Tax=Cantharellus anzutake TaxID=1750568 RepID=UPI001904211D|nr:cytochrome P450 monooxygenase CYP63 [Cantharellus anzutake]KAF8337360.1 cytochrome P450 monooxygenase CYP63 [Cantharellus anzutake]